MTPHAAYAAFMLDYAAGTLSPAEKLAGDLHRALSRGGQASAGMLDTVGGALLEQAPPSTTRTVDPAGWIVRREEPSEAQQLLAADLLALPWRRKLLGGVRELPARTPMAHLLRLDPGERAWRHAHGRRDVTVVLCGTFADDFGEYQRGDIAFAEPGMRHQPRAMGDQPCVCLIATQSGRPLSGLLGVFGLSLPEGPREN